MAQIVCGQCENRHVIETLGADVMFAALTVSSVESSRSSAELIRRSTEADCSWLSIIDRVQLRREARSG